MLNTRLVLGITIIGSLLAAGACSKAAADEGSDISGTITGITGQTVMVDAPDNNSSDKFVIQVNDDTQLFVLDDGVYDQVDLAGIEAGQKIDIWISGGIMESYPAQAVAKKMVVAGKSLQNNMPPLDGGRPWQKYEITDEEFGSSPNVTKEIEMTFPGCIWIYVPSNPTTGYSWNETASIENGDVIYQVEHNFIPPEDGSVMGAPGKEYWIINSREPGTSIVTFEYARPWETTGPVRTLQLIVTVN